MGINLRIAFHFNKDSIGNYVTTMDSPDQSAYGMATDYTTLKNDSIFTGINKYKVSFAGLLINDTTINGTFKQTASVPLILKKVAQVGKAKRPQTPVDPQYKIEEVSYSSGLNKIAGTLSYPKVSTYEKFPTVLLITGSGPQNRDEEIMGHKPFAVISHYLTMKGFMVLRVDDRGIGESTGDFNSATSADFADDVQAGIAFLRQRKDVDLKKIGLLGHSEGAMIAQIVAAKRKDIDFLILMAGPGIKPVDLMTEQNVAIFKSMGISEKTRDAYRPLYKSMALGVVTAKDSVAAAKNTFAVLQAWIKGKDSSMLKELGLETTSRQKTYLKNMNDALTGPWYKYFMTYDPAPNLKKINAKVLAINGDKDVQVLPQSNLGGIEAGLKNTKSVYEIHTIKGVNHLFQKCNSCTVNEYGMLEETISPEVLELVGSWLARKVVED